MSPLHYKNSSVPWTLFWSQYGHFLVSSGHNFFTVYQGKFGFFNWIFKMVFLEILASAN